MGIAVMQRDFFDSRPVYLDRQQTMLKSLGKKVTLCNLCALIFKMGELRKRQKGMNLTGNLNGDGSVLGGVLVLGKGGAFATFQQEKLGMKVDYDKIVEDVRLASQ
uniref:Peroxiredoxin-like 2 activated in M-CSF stimulated monocytes n=1 Tax=Hemiselmis andersenii TaxID=464988 RepID=A0A6U2I7I3_HEMAN|mmetsp:Transcript_4761/g.10992  ORF Transcript_4761/g.10992 Transcript_4761/m.10992 type:complete len:106 (-) Transcript_4761:283-600(-)